MKSSPHCGRPRQHSSRSYWPSGRDVAVFVVLTGLMAKKFSERVILSSSDATKTYNNIDYTPLNEIRASISNVHGCAPQELPKPTVARFVNVEENILQESSIGEILEARLPNGTSVIHRTCEATIVTVLEDEGWYYNCCTRCSRKVHLVDGSYYCNHCAKDASDFRPRFRLIVRVEDNSAWTTFTLFNKEAEELIGVPVEKIIGEIYEIQIGMEVAACQFLIKEAKFDLDFSNKIIDGAHVLPAKFLCEMDKYKVPLIKKISRSMHVLHTGFYASFTYVASR